MNLTGGPDLRLLTATDRPAGVEANAFLNPKGMAQQDVELACSSDEEKQSQLKRLAGFHAGNAQAAPAGLAKLR
jgi:methylmalonyl-CoA mutase